MGSTAVRLTTAYLTARTAAGLTFSRAWSPSSRRTSLGLRFAPAASYSGTASAPSDSPGSSKVLGDSPVVVQSPHADVHIPDNVGLAEHILNNCRKYGNATALIDGETGEKTSYAQLETQVTRVASALLKAGLQKGDVVTLFSPNCPEFAVVYLAVIAAGGVLSALNPVYTAGELKHALIHGNAKLLVVGQSLVPIAKQVVGECPEVKGIISIGQAEGCRPIADLLADDGSAFSENIDFDPKDDLAALPYSSGTTGLPKGVMLSHYNIVANVQQLSTPSVLGLCPEDILVAVLPFFHIYGQVVVMLNGLFSGSKVITLPRFEANNYLSTISKYRATFLHIVPPLALLLASHPLVEKYDLSSVRSGLTGAAPVSKNVLERVEGRLKHSMAFRQGYGLTECSPVTHCNPPFDNNHASIGPPVHNTEAKIVNISTGEALGYGHEGELWVRGPQVMKGYLNNPKATADTVDQDGWLHTGDLGYCQPDGHFFITDRLKELIKVKGLQVAPAELEALLLDHPAVGDCAVIGVPDDRAGEAPRAYVVLKANQKVSEDDITEYVKANVAPYKQLSGGVEFIKEVPKSASGKILRRHLKTAFMETR